MKLNNARLKTLPLDKSVCDGANLYFTRTGPERGKWSFRYQRLGKKREMGLGPYPAISLAEARQRARELHSLIHQGKDPLYERKEAERQRRKREGKRFSDIASSSGSDNKQIKAGVAIRYLKSVNGAVTAYSLLERQSRSINEETEEEKAFENICRTLDTLAGIRASNLTLNDAEFRMFVTEAVSKL